MCALLICQMGGCCQNQGVHLTEETVRRQGKSLSDIAPLAGVLFHIVKFVHRRCIPTKRGDQFHAVRDQCHRIAPVVHGSRKHAPVGAIAAHELQQGSALKRLWRFNPGNVQKGGCHIEGAHSRLDSHWPIGGRPPGSLNISGTRKTSSYKVRM